MTQTVKRTVCVKLDVGPHADVLALTMGAFNAAATWIAGVCWSESITNGTTLHHRVYQETRQQYGLGAQLAECARNKAMEAVRAGRTSGSTTCPSFGSRGAVRYDVHTYRLKSRDQVSLATLEGRVLCQMLPGGRQRTLLMDLAWRIGGADLVYRDGTYYLHIVQTKDAPGTMDGGGVLGVDMGRVQIATDSDGEHHSGAKVKGMRAYYRTMRARLQKVGTHSSRRKLQKVKRRESRFVRNTNHVISRTIVNKAAASCKTLALEDLTGIRGANVRHEQRAEHHTWAFYQLRVFLVYKAAAVGVPVVFVDPAYTSQACSKRAAGYAAALSARSLTRGVVNCPGAYIAITDSDAQAAALEQCHELFPEAEGYIHHRVGVVPITRWWYALSPRMKKSVLEQDSHRPRATGEGQP